MQVKKVEVGYLKENCYEIEHNGKCLIVDPGDDFFIIDRMIDTTKLLAVLITHRHKDHIGALKNIKEKYNVPVYEFKNLKEGRYEIDDFKFEVVFTPGHTIDSVSYYFYEYNFLFDGDFIFKNTIGRTDLGGDDIDMINSLKKISTFNKKMKLYPGHGESTILFDELENNIYLKNAIDNM